MMEYSYIENLHKIIFFYRCFIKITEIIKQSVLYHYKHFFNIENKQELQSHIESIKIFLLPYFHIAGQVKSIIIQQRFDLWPVSGESSIRLSNIMADSFRFHSIIHTRESALIHSINVLNFLSGVCKPTETKLSYILMRWSWCSICTRHQQTELGSCIASSLKQVDMLFHSDKLSWFLSQAVFSLTH